MSASDKKRLRKEQNAAAMTERQKAEQKEAKKLKSMTLTFAVVMVLVVAIVVGVSVRSPIAGVAFTIGALSMVGFPFLGGFVSKLNLAQAALDMGGIRSLLPVHAGKIRHRHVLLLRLFSQIQQNLASSGNRLPRCGNLACYRCFRYNQTRRTQKIQTAC